MDLSTFFIQMLNGIQQGLLLFLIASGLTLIFGIMHIINLAHGALYMIGAYLAFWLTSVLGNFWLAAIAALPIALLLGIMLEKLLIQRIYKRNHLDQVLLTFGLILIFNALQSILWGNDVHAVPIPESLRGAIVLTENLDYPIYRLFLSGICIAIAIAMYLILQKTRLGMIVRGGASNREMVQALGINISWTYTSVFAVGATLAAFAGVLAAPISSVYPSMGNDVLIICFVVVVIGGIGSIKGAFVGALMVGLASTWGAVLVPHFAGAVVYALMAMIVLWKPRGLFA
ncbi:ABC transporter permease [Ectopseudomonas alcaliphila JAB1]|nr:branched-chain amino acid ABC transporter permease [Pseudomonas alcaliphila]APU29476.1 ABC transporter permease [Pseudomonas alcaliphila JAB1]